MKPFLFAALVAALAIAPVQSSPNIGQPFPYCTGFSPKASAERTAALRVQLEEHAHSQWAFQVQEALKKSQAQKTQCSKAFVNKKTYVPAN